LPGQLGLAGSAIGDIRSGASISVGWGLSPAAKARFSSKPGSRYGSNPRLIVANSSQTQSFGVAKLALHSVIKADNAVSLDQFGNQN